MTKPYPSDVAIVKILKVLNSRMAVMSKPMRDEALTLAEEYGITAKDLIEAWTKIAERI
jgi:3-hydroxyisobutyrate dehydrogenase-like beta-hydroxyacid dehydrogenase